MSAYLRKSASQKHYLKDTNYQTAWTCLHKMRRSMVRPKREHLQGHIEVDETYVGGPKTGVNRGRCIESKQLVVIGIGVLYPKGYGRVSMRWASDVSGQSHILPVRDVVEPGSDIFADNWDGYNDLTQFGYVRHQVILSGSGDCPNSKALSPYAGVFVKLIRCLLRSHQGAVRIKHLDDYLDERSFTFNRRTSNWRASFPACLTGGKDCVNTLINLLLN